MQKILMISGKKQSGKSSATNYLTGYLLQQAGVIKRFKLDDETGDLLINIKVTNPENGEEVEELGKLDIYRKDDQYFNMAQRGIWPIIKPYNFGDNLKEIGINVFGLKREELYGSNDDKNKLTHIRWKDVDKLVKTPNYKKTDKTFLTNREWLEIYGTEVCRTMYDDCWVSSCFNQIVLEGYPFCVISDFRFKSEDIYSKQIQGVEIKTVRLTRDPFSSQHSAEVDLDNFEGFDKIIDNTNMNQVEKGIELIRTLQEWGWCN